MKDYTETLLPDNFYHIYNRSVGWEKLFMNHGNYCYFIRLFIKYISPVADTFSYNLLPGHFHFFLRIKSIDQIRRRMDILNYKHRMESNHISIFLLQQFGNFFNAYAKAYNKQHDRSGRIFTESFKRRIITTRNSFPVLIHDIHANAVYHGYCDKIEDWPYSSFCELLQKGNGWLNGKEAISFFGSIDEYKRYHDQNIIREYIIQRPPGFLNPGGCT